MKPQRFIQNYKCECFQPYNYCNCPFKSMAGDVLVEKVRDVATTLVEVMNLCGIPGHKAKLSVDVVIYYFLHFEEVLIRIDSVPRKRLSKEDLFHDLQRKCSMERMEAQVAYSIIKRAFRAFYHGTGEGGVPNPVMHQQLIHTSQCMWVHAAKRTAQVYAAYEGMFLVTQKDFEQKIKSLYKTLYDRMSLKLQPEENNECTCTKCAKRIMIESLKTAKVTTHMHSDGDTYEEMYRRIVEKMTDHGHDDDEGGQIKDLEKKGSRRCTCASLNTTNNDLKFREAARSCNTGYSQGPFDCHWLSIDKEEYEADDVDPVLQLPEEFPCPPCDEDRSSCDSECECTCEVCTCGSGDDFDCGEGESGEGDAEALSGVGDAAAEDEAGITVTEEEALSEETLIQVDTDMSDKEFSLKYSGCKNPAKSLITSTQSVQISPQNRHKKRKSSRKSGTKSNSNRSSGTDSRANNTSGSELFLTLKPTETDVALLTAPVKSIRAEMKESPKASVSGRVSFPAEKIHSEVGDIRSSAERKEAEDGVREILKGVL